MCIQACTEFDIFPVTKETRSEENFKHRSEWEFQFSENMPPTSPLFSQDFKKKKSCRNSGVEGTELLSLLRIRYFVHAESLDLSLS